MCLGGQICIVSSTKCGKGRRIHTTAYIASEADRDIVLLEYKAPYRRKPNSRVRQYCKPQIWMGLDLSPIASFALYVEVVYHLCTLEQLDPTPCHNTSYQGDTNHAWTSPVAWGCMVVLGKEGVETPVDYGAASIDTLYTTMEEIASVTHQI